MFGLVFLPLKYVVEFATGARGIEPANRAGTYGHYKPVLREEHPLPPHFAAAFEINRTGRLGKEKHPPITTVQHHRLTQPPPPKAARPLFIF